MAITDGEKPVSDMAWSKLSGIIVKVEVVQKEGQKLYNRFRDLPTQGDNTQRQLNELEDCLMNLDDEKNKLEKVYKYRKGQDRAIIQCFESHTVCTICLYT